MPDGTHTITEASVARFDPRPFQLLDTTDNGSHVGIEEPGQVYADVKAHQFGRTVTITTCEGSVDIDGPDFERMALAYLKTAGVL